jgi:Raf kinase inhibitor-like YbhB/YbcL family protein
MKPRFVLPCLLLAVLVPFFVPAGHVNAARPLPATTAATTQPPLPLLPTAWDSDRRFELKSTTFEDHQFIPASMIFNGQLGSVCTGGNESPELSWTPGARGTRSYAVTLYDVTANFAHWGMYNIPPTTTQLAVNAGAPGNGLQVFNDALIQGYSGPCPPPDLVPNGIHHYVFTVYALDKELDLTVSPDFPPAADGLYRGMIGHVIEQASITGLFGCTDQNANACN